MSGVLTPNEGKVIVNGKVAALLELGSGFNPEFTGIQNIFFYGAILGFSHNEMDAEIDSILAFAEIGEFIYQPLKTYSSGMKARLGFAVAVHLDPDVLILDEVLSVGDALFRRKCHARMQDYFDSGKTVIYVSHDTDSINSICTRAIFLHEGKSLIDADVKTVSMLYHKYLFSDENNKKNLLNDLASKSFSIEAGENEDRKEDVLSNGGNEEAFIIEGFAPKSTVTYKNYNVDISNYMIVDHKGVVVNSLVIGEKYIFRFDVKFYEDFKSVKFGCSIKNEKGVILSGLTMPSRLECLEKAASGEKYNISAEFRCELSMGNYFFDVGVTSDINNEKIYLNMIHDALVFKVQPAECDYWGMVNLWCDSHVLKVKPTSEV